MNIHTIGPWKIDFGNGKIVSNGGHVATMRPTCVTSTWEADARLIAAAPDLLSALELIIETYGFDPSIDSSIWQTAHAAIVKAKGQLQVRPDAVGGKPPRTDHGRVLAVGEYCVGGWGPDFYGEINWSCRCGATHPKGCITETANDNAS